MKQSWEAPNDFQKTSPGSFSVFWFPARDVNEITYECDHIQRNYLKTNQPHCLNSLRKLLKLNHFFFCFSPLPCSQLSKLQTILRRKRKEICFVFFDHYSEADIGDPFDQPHHHHHQISSFDHPLIRSTTEWWSWFQLHWLKLWLISYGWFEIESDTGLWSSILT